MGLTLTEALDAVKSPPNALQIRNGATYQSKLRVLTLPLELHDLEKEKGWKALLGSEKRKLTAEKYNEIAKFFTYPLAINMMSNDIMLDLYKVFDGRNANFSVDYMNDRAKNMGNEVLAKLDILNWIEETGKGVLKCAPNTIVVIDKDAQGDPILLPVANEQLVGYQFTDTGEFDYVIFVHSKGANKDKQSNWTKYAVYDDEQYRVILEKDGHYSEDSVFTHTLGKCPARFFYNNPLIDKRKFARSIPIGTAKGLMEQWQIIDTYNYHQDNYASFQVVQYHDSDCNRGCEDGLIYINPTVNGEGETTKSGYSTACPSCEKKGLIGPGSAIGIKLGIDKDDVDARGIFGFIAPHIPPLEYSQKRNEARERKIKENTVGYSDAITSDAINETQVKALVESRKKPIFDIKFHLEGLYKWATESTLKLTLDIESKANGNYGTEFFILGAAEIQDLIIKSKLAGSQATYIEQLNKLLIVTQYKSDPSLMARMLITADVQPHPFSTQTEVRDLLGENMISREDYYMHSNFTDLLNQFELDNGPITAFGIEKDYSKRIEAIKEIFFKLISQKIPDEPEESTDDNTESAKGSQAGTK